MTLKEQLARIIDPDSWRIKDDYPERPELRQYARDRSLVKAETILAMIEGPRPIENAPKDGSAIDLFVFGRRITDCYYNQVWRAWARTEGYPSVEHILLSLEPTHWTPVPKFPQ